VGTVALDTEQPWVGRATRIAAELARAPFGKKREVYAWAAKEYGYAVSSLKREVAAAEFIERVSSGSPDFAAELRSLGSNAVGEIARLHVSHPELARAKSKAAAGGRITASDISRARQEAEAGSEARTGRGRAREFVRFVAEEGRRFGIEDTRKPRVAGSLLEFRIRGGETGCAVFESSPAPGLEKVDRHLAMLLFHDRLVVGFEGEQVPDVWQRRIRELRGHGQRVLLFTRAADGFREATRY
jgi:hypothetical protein